MQHNEALANINVHGANPYNQFFTIRRDLAAPIQASVVAPRLLKRTAWATLMGK